MAKYTVTRNCGHTEEVQLYGKISERERKIEWMEKGECRNCYNKSNSSDNCGVKLTVKNASLLVTGNTYAIKDTLKSIGYRWDSQRKAWYWDTTVGDADQGIKIVKDTINQIDPVIDGGATKEELLAL